MSGTLPNPGGYTGAAWYFTATGDMNALVFLVEQIISGRAFVALVQVKSAAGGTASGKPPRVSVQPMVAQVDGQGNQVPHGVVYDLPCFRLQGGNGAIVLDPAVGDIGVAVICDRDISNVKATGATSGPGSWRQNDWADGCYFGGFLNTAPTQSVAFSIDGIAITTPGTLTLSAASIVTTGTLTNNGSLVGSTHIHGGVQTGGSDTGPPT